MYEVAQASIADSFTLLIGAAARFASIASLIVNPRFPGLDMTGHQALDRLARWSIDKSEVTEWPGTQLLSTHASIYRYHIDAEFTRELLAIGPSLESWIQPGLPEDPMPPERGWDTGSGHHCSRGRPLSRAPSGRRAGLAV
jgi:hypothetical protein